MTIAKKKDTGFEKWSEIKVTHKNASFRPRIAIYARISDIHLLSEWTKEDSGVD